MSSLLFLNSKEFAVQKGPKGPIMCHSVPGFTLILFYSHMCPHCQNLIPVFKRLPGTVNGCQFGIVNIHANPACRTMSDSTIAPIKYVPFIMLYIDGRPFMSYTGPYTAAEIQRFVIDVANNLQKKQEFSREKVREDPEGGGIPTYSIGKPISGGKDQNVCYLTFLDAYTAKTSASSSASSKQPT